MHARTMENTNRRRNAPTEATAKPRTRYSSFTADHGRDLGDHGDRRDQRQRDQHRPRDLTDDATNTEGTPRRRPILLDSGPGDLTRDPLHDLHRRPRHLGSAISGGACLFIGT